jgi:nitronate monooxygenase
MSPSEIEAWAAEFRANSSAPFQLNTWIPDPPAVRDAAREAEIRSFLSAWGPAVPAHAADAKGPDFEAQCAVMLKVNPSIISSIMGLYPVEYVKAMKDRGISWFAVATTVEEAKLAEEAGADVIVAQGAEAGGHRGSFRAEEGENKQVGLFALLPAIVDAVRIPVVATGGIGDGRGVAAALLMGASAVQIGTGFLRCPEAKIHRAWADAISKTPPEATRVSRVFSGRPGRSILNDYVRAATAPNAPKPAPHPVQRNLTASMRMAALREGDIQRMQAWAGQSALMAQALPAKRVMQTLWSSAKQFLPIA